MGNSTSLEAQNALVSSEEKEEKYIDEEELSETIKKLTNELKQIELSLKEDPSEGNALLQYSKMIKLKHDINGGLTGIKDIVANAQTQWNTMDEHLDALKKHVPKEVEDIKGLKIDYFSLLRRTGVALASLIEQSEIQRYNIKNLIRLANIQLESDDLIFEKRKDEKMYDLCMRRLIEFINDSVLENIVEEWKYLCKKLQKKQEILYGLYKKYKKQRKYKQIAMATGVSALMIVLTFGVAAPFVAVLGAEAIATGGISLGAGSVTAVTAASAYRKYRKCYIQTQDTLSKMQDITTMVEFMLQMDRESEKKIGQGMLLKQLQLCSNERLKRAETNIIFAINAFETIDEYLQVYSKEGHEVADIINKAVMIMNF